MFFVMAITLFIVYVAVLAVGVWQDGGLNTEADAIVVDSDTWRLHLYQNNFTPTTTSVLGDFVESTFPGYAAQNLTWTPGAISGNNKPIPSGSIANTTTFINLEFVFGYYITDSTDTVLYGAELFGFPGPFDMSVVGTVIQVTVLETLTRV